MTNLTKYNYPMLLLLLMQLLKRKNIVTAFIIIGDKQQIT